MITDALGEESVRFCHKAYGAIAQLGEHLLCTQGVSGSNPLSSTTYGGLSITGTAAVLKTVHVKACESSSLSSSARSCMQTCKWIEMNLTRAARSCMFKCK